MRLPARLGRMATLLALVVTLPIAIQVIRNNEASALVRYLPGPDDPDLNASGYADAAPDYAYDIKKIEDLCMRQDLGCASAAEAALTSPNTSVRRYASIALGAQGTDDDLTPITNQLALETDPGVLSELELAQFRIQDRLAINEPDKEATVLADAMKSVSIENRAWAAKKLATLQTPFSQQVIDQVKEFETDSSVLDILNGATPPATTY